MKLDKNTILKKMLEARLFDRKQINEAIAFCNKQNEDLYDYLKSRLDNPTEKIARFFLDYFDYQPIVLTDIVLNPEVVNKVPTELMVNHLIIPAFQVRQRVFVAVSNPMDIEGLKAVMKYTGETSALLLSSKEHIIEALAEYIFKPKIISILK